jgi:tRNA (cytidine/uridine-2'-O-)-methyltransferase
MSNDAMFDIVLVHPEIPPNAGNVIRLAANAGCRLHLVEPLGFSMEDKQLKRAGLDYHEMVNVTVHRDWPACREALARRRMLALSTRAARVYTKISFQPGDVFVFGAETSGLPGDILDSFSEENRLTVPMRPGNRSLNLSNAVAVVVFEAWRQLDFRGSR